MQSYSVAIYTTTYDPDNVVDGERGEDARTDTDLVVVDTVDEAIDVLRNQGLTQPSAVPMPDNVEYVWYSHPDGYSDPYTGEREDVSGHLSGFTRDEAATIYRAVRS